MIGFKKLFGLLFNPKKELEYWWHSPSEDFEYFDFSKIGINALKYGWGIYFSETFQKAIEQNKSLGHIYRLKVEDIGELTFLYYSEDLKEPCNQGVRSEAIKFYGEQAFNSECFNKSGHTFYKDILESESKKAEVFNGCAARFLVNANIVGGIIDELSERIIVIYDTELWEKVERVDLIEDQEGEWKVKSRS